MDIHKLKPYVSRMQNSLWHFDAYPDLPDLRPGSTVEMFHGKGPGIIRTIHLTLDRENDIGNPNRDEILRKVFLKITYNGLGHSAVHVPIGDFFCDSFDGRSIPFAGPLMAKRPTHSYFCYIPMPYEHEVRVELINESDLKMIGYGYVTAESLPAWESDCAYFHACWREKTIKIPQQAMPLLQTTGKGHFLGCHLTAVSPCPHFKENMGICEGNDEFYIDGAKEPTCNYLGTEDFFGFSWNWRSLWQDAYSGTTYLNDDDGVTKLACYRFLLNDPIRFDRSLKAIIDYEHENKNEPLIRARKENNGDVTFATTVYWYQALPVDCFEV